MKRVLGFLAFAVLSANAFADADHWRRAEVEAWIKQSIQKHPWSFHGDKCFLHFRNGQDATYDIIVSQHGVKELFIISTGRAQDIGGDEAGFRLFENGNGYVYIDIAANGRPFRAIGSSRFSNWFCVLDFRD